ncbi:hypothetical protein BC629DRAFT_1573274 [Irpex lacteus]|nr:hypothetical protein BC629DRAFT_1573274 [Irpex lacteus]
MEAATAPTIPSEPEIDWSKPHPLFLDMFRDEPELVGAYARDMFSNDSILYMSFILSFPWGENILELPDALHSGDFLVALLDIVSHELWYAQMRDTTTPERIVMQRLVAMKLYLTLKCICRLVITSQAGEVYRPQNEEVCKRCIERFPALWGHMWRNRDIVLQRDFSRSDGEIFEFARKLLECHFLLSKKYLNDVPPLTSHIAHIAFLLWDRRDQPSWMIHMTSYFVLEVLKFKSKEEANLFLEEVVPVVISERDPMEYFRDALLRQEKDMTEPSNLYHHLFICLLVLRGCKSDIVVTDEGRREALFALVRVFQRYQCHGNMTGAPDSGRRIGEVMLKCLNWFQERDYEALMKDMFLHPYELDFVQVVATVLVPVYTRDSDFLLHSTISLLIIAFEQFGEHTRNIREPIGIRVYAHLRRILQAHWLPVLQDIRTAIRSPDRAYDEDPEVTGQLRDVMEMWEGLGRLYRLDKRSQERDSVQSLIGYLLPWERLQGCFLRECPCYGRRAPWHKSRRVCKGCWAAFYCSKQCQKRYAFMSCDLASRFNCHRIGTGS